MWVLYAPRAVVDLTEIGAQSRKALAARWRPRCRHAEHGRWRSRAKDGGVGPAVRRPKAMTLQWFAKLGLVSLQAHYAALQAAGNRRVR